MTCCDVEYFLLNFFHFAVGHYLQSKCCLLLSVLNTRVEYFGESTEDAIAAWRIPSDALYVPDVHGYVVCTCR